MKHFNWQHIEFKDGSNPYISMTENNFKRMKRKYNLTKIKEGFWLAEEKNPLNHIIVSYNENWDCGGYHTTQNIKLSKHLLNRFNIFLTDYRKPIEKKITISNTEMELLMYGKNIDNLNRCLTLTQLRLLYQFLMENNIDCNRIKLNRNTMLIVV